MAREKMDHIKECGNAVVERYRIIDPCDQVVRVFLCMKHGVHDYMFPDRMMLVWPDGTMNTWEAD